ncbi:HTH-type transcriptional regulatory protein gabR [Mannheimia haemolytica]|uniref:HTH-type transcriptional regulatory protein gabR n=1 Tax=Mannheimia haemolytica TaxID=75985 RepID=A0A378MSX6_MANHA|nr:HTH-type transcriptional regulatory protein gabR [Mannheimia haemolytica]
MFFLSCQIMLTYTFNTQEGTALYEQLYRFLKNDIESNILIAGDKLPSKRAFAKHLGISVMTVETAYQQLVAEGYVNTQPKKGFFVNALNLPEKKEAISVQLQKISSEQYEKNKKWQADLTNRQTLAENFPFSVWTKLVREVLKTHQSELMERAESGGVWTLKFAIANHLRAFRGMIVNPTQIIIGAGTEYLYGLLIQLLGLDKHYALTEPSYDKLRRIYHSYRLSTATVSMPFSIDELNSKNVDVIHTSPSHHFPTGHVMPIAKRYELLAWVAQKAERYIVEDDYDSEFRFVGQPIPALKSIDMLGRVIYMNTFSKTLSSTVRIAYMVLPPELLNRFQQELGFYASTVSNFEQYILAEFIQQGYFEKHINRMRTYYQKKRDKLLKAFKQGNLAEKIAIKEEHSGLHFIVQLNTTLTERQILQAAEEQGIKFVALSAYYQDKSQIQQNAFIIGYSNLKDDQINYVAESLKKILDNE